MRSAAVAFAVLALPTSASAANPRPFTIPALRDWKGGRGAFTLPKDPTVAAPRRLSDVARTLAAELGGATGRRGAIRLVLGSSPHGPESYRLSIGHTVTITASTPT